jgi:protocatechuate 3,4-dioxygenase beta subunit
MGFEKKKKFWARIEKNLAVLKYLFHKSRLNALRRKKSPKKHENRYSVLSDDYNNQKISKTNNYKINTFKKAKEWFKSIEIFKFFDNRIAKIGIYLILAFSIAGAAAFIVNRNDDSAKAASITSITPNTGATLGGYEVTINGTNFAQGEPQRVVTINNPGSTITDYEGNITLDTASLITQSKLRNDCGDIRVKDSDGTTDLQYWIDGDCNSSNTVIWFKKPTLPAGSSTVIVQYGNSSLTSQSSISNFSFGGVLTSSSNKLWLSANSGVGTSTDGTAIQTWTDRSGNNNNATQATAGNRPVLKNNIQNGKPVVRFVQNGVTQGFTFPTTSLKETFLVFNHPTGSSPRFSADYETVVLGDGNNQPFHGNTGTGLVGCTWVTGPLCSGTAFVNGSSQAITAMTKSTNFRNVNFNLPSNINVSNIALGHGLFRSMNGDVPEILVFNTSLSTQDRQSVETYLNRKYNLYGSNPTISVAAESGLIGGITFGGNPATNIEFISSTEFRVIVPASTLPGDKTGSVDVVVTNPDNSSVTLTNGFAYSAPVISSITPNTGATLGDYEVTINGANFVNSNYKRTVTLNNTAGVLTNAKSSISLDTASLISAGKMRSDCGDIRVQNNNESQDLNYWIEYGCNTTTTLIHFNIPTLNIGSNTFYIKYGDLALTTLSNGDIVYPAINANAASLRQWIKATDGPSTTTSGATVSSVLDRSGNSNNWNLQGGFSGATYNPTGINGKPSLSFNGSNSYQFANRLTDIRTVIMFWNETAAGSGAGSFILGDTGSYDFHRNGNNYFGCCQSGNITNGTFRINGASVAPASAQAVYNSPVILSMTTSGNVSANTFNKDRVYHGPFIGQLGESMIFNQALSANDIANIESYISAKYNLNSNLTATLGSESGAGGSITFGGNPATGVQYISSTELRVIVPTSILPGDKTGSVNVVVTNPDGVSGTLTNGFTYSAPVITSITPNTGATLGGYEVTINGANFTNSNYKRTVTLNNTGAALTDYQVNFSLDTASLVTANKLRSDCGDIRVFDTDGTTSLNYWVESGCNTASSSIWVRVPSLPTGSKDIFIEYGDSALNSLSSLVNTLPVLAGSSNRAWLSSLDFTLASGATISNWIDRTALPGFGGDGIAHNFTQATVSKYPTYQTSILNGKPVVNFTASSGQTLVNSTNFSSPYTIVYLSRQTGGSNQRVLSGLGDNFLAGYWGGGRDQLYDDATIRLSGGNPPSDTAWRIYTASGNSSIAKLWNNGIEVASAGGNWSGPSGISLNGQQAASEFSDAQIAEVLVFNTYLSDSDRNSVQNYLNQKFGVHGTLPTVTVASESGSGSSSITFGGNAATGVQYISSTEFRVTVPASTLAGDKTGSVDVVVTNPDGVSGTLTNGFSYAAPVVTSITPSSGPDNGGTFVTINGSNFSNLRASGSLISRYVTINNPGSTITNYEGNITLDTASLITQSKLRNDCGDIRVKDSDGTTDLQYWIDGDCNSSNTVIWFKKPTLPAGSSTVVLKHGDSGLTSQSNISNFSFGSVLTSANNRLWLSANSGVGTSTDGAAIQTWNDRSGNNNNATQATAGNRPILKNNIQNGKPVVRFDGSNDFLQLPNSNASLNLTQGSLFTLAKSADAGTSYRGIMVKSPAYGNFWVDNIAGTYDWQNNVIVTRGSALNNNNAQLMVNQFNSGVANGSNIYINGVQTGNSYTMTVNSQSQNGVIGSGADNGSIQWFGGDIPEILLFNSSLSTQDRQIVETYLNTKYNLYGSGPVVSLGGEANFSILLNGQLLGNTTFINPTTLTGYIPAGTGTQNVTVTNSDGTSGTLNNAYTYGVNGVPNPIFDLAITNNESENVPLSWTAPFDNGSTITDYIIKYSTDNFATETIVNDGVNTNTSYTIIGLTPGNSYQFKVIAVNGVGNSPDSNIFTISSLDCDTNLNGADFTPTNGATLTGRYCNIGTFTVSSGFTVNVAVGSKLKIYSQNASILGNLNADLDGFQGVQTSNTNGNGPGAGGGNGNWASGGGYGGNGSRGNNGSGGLAGISYGSITEPTDLGSSGGGGSNGGSGSGGGAIKLNITNTLTNNGSITANGGTANGNAGGGSGGSIWITTNTLAGSGVIRANGGNAGNNGGAGGGGRIALYYNTKTLSGAVTATGGAATGGAGAGGAGTVYEKFASDEFGSLTISSNGTIGASTEINNTFFTPNSLKNLFITSGSVLFQNKALTLQNTVFTSPANSQFYQFQELTFTNVLTDVNISGYWESRVSPTATSQANLTINSGGNFTTSQNTTVAANLNYRLDLTFNTLTINSGGAINADLDGFQGVQTSNTNGNGPGAGGGNGNWASGGGYGGNGSRGNNGSGGLAGISYGSITEPTDLGSSGGGGSNGGSGSGGGAIKLNITNTLTNNGSITANGGTANGNAGGGSGGSIWITTNTLAGSGVIRANGGNAGNNGGAGGGGRIALYYNTKTLSGAVTATGGAATGGAGAGGAGTIYEPNTPQVGLTDSIFSPNPNPISTGATFTASITNIKNTFGFNLFSGTCSVNITGPGGYSQSFSGTVNTGVCTISSSYPAPTISGTGYSAELSVTGATTETKTVTFEVATTASNKAKIAGGNLPVYTSVAVNPANPLIGTNYTISGTGFVDSGNDQALNGIPCSIAITGPNSYSDTFVTGNIVGGNCSFSFNSSTLPKVAGTYTAVITVEGDAGNLVTTPVNFNYYFDIYLTTGSGFDLAGNIPGTITSSQASIVQGDPNPVFTSPIIRRYDNSTLIPTGTACSLLVTIASGPEINYNSTTNSSGQCVVTVPNNSFTGGSLSVRFRVTIEGNNFFTNPNTSILIQNFPSNKAKADDAFTTQPKLTAQTATPSPTLIGTNYTLSVTGLEDSLINARPLAGLNCVIIVTGPNSYLDNQTVAITNGTCTRTYSGNIPQIPGQYSFKVQVAGDSGILETPVVNFDRLFNIRLTGGTPGISGSITGATTSSQNPILLNTATTLTSPAIRNYADNANLSGLTCRNVLKINSGSDQFYNGTLNGSGRCVTVVPSGDITSLGTAYIKTQVSTINSDFDPAYTFENSNSVLQIRNPPTSQICANETFRDDNKNGVRDGSEPLLAGVVTRLKNASNTTVLNTLNTSAGGPNCFTGLFDDTYYLEQVLPTGGTLWTSSLSFQVILGVAATENRSFGYNGDAVICPSPTFIDINQNGIYETGGGDYLLAGIITNLYLTSDLNNSIQQITTNAGGNNCFTAIKPGNYTVIQDAPALTTSTTGTVVSNKVSQNITLNFGTNFNQKFGYSIIPSQKAKPQASPNQSKPIYTSIAQLTTVNPTYNEKAFVNYPVSATISGLVDSNTNLALSGTGICSATFDGPSFASPVTVNGLNVSTGSCLVDNTNNSSVIPTSTGSGNTVVFTIEGPSGNLVSDPHTFEVFSGNVSVCAIPFADYNLNGSKESNEPYLAGIEVRLYKDAGATLVDTINSNISGTACFTNQAPGIAYSVIQTAPAGTSLTTGTLSRDFTPFPETINNFAYAYKGDSTITPSAFRDDNRNGINNSETALNAIFTVTLRDYANNIISSNLSINGTNQFINLLPTSVLGGNYSLQVNTGSLVVTNTTNNNPATVSSLSNGSNQDVSFGYASDATICPNPSFYDYNKNGIRDGSEPNISGLTTRLLLAVDNSEIATLSTTGSNCFTAVIPDNYIIEQTHPTGAILTSTPGTQASGKITTPVTSTFGVNQTRAFGYKGDATICPSPTFQDLNKDGIKDGNEPLISGLNTVLRDLNGVTMQTLSTNGTNCFTEILAGDYQIIQTPPSNSTSTTGGTTKNVTVVATQNLDVAFGYNGEPLVCPVVFRDDNGDGIQNNGETSLEGSTLTLKDSLDVQVGNTILSNGTIQCFEPLSIGQNYTVTATSPAGYTSTTSLTASISATFGQRYTPSFGFNGNATVCVTNSFNDINMNGAVDSGESSISGLVTRIRVNGSNTDIQSLTTDSSGNVCFNPLPPGQYRVIQTGPTGTGSTTGGDQIFTLTPAQSKNIIFGYSGSGAICVDLYNDLDFNGRKDSGETRIPNITTELYLQSDLVTPISTRTTNGSTNVCFTQLQGGDYQVKIVTTGYLNDNTFDTTTGGSTQNVTLAEGNIFYSTQSFGYTNNPDFFKGAFRGLVYMDRNENGEYNTRGNDGVEATVYDNDIPIVEKQVNLLKDIGGGNFQVQDTQVTNSLGEFNFLSLDPGEYKVEIANDTGIVAVIPSPSTRTFTITTNEKTYDLYGFQYTAQICPSIFVDRNNNGVFDGGDIDLIQTNGLYVQLEYQSFGGTQIFGGGNANGILLNTANPCITKVPPRNYTFRLSGANNLAGMFDSTYYSQRNPIGNPSTTIFLGNTTTPTIRYYTNAVTTLSSMYGKVWHDRPEGSSTIDLDGTDNKTGVENVNSRDYDRDYDNDFAYVGYSVSLRKCGPVAGETINDLNAWNANPPTTTTDANGDYVFSNIPTGLYAVIVNTAIPYQNQTQSFGRGYECNIFNNTFFNGLYFNGGGGIAPGSNVKYDVIYYYTPTVDAQLWIDTNRNGIQEYWENSSYYKPYSANFELSNSNGLIDFQQLKYFTNGNSNFASAVTPNNYTLNFLTDSNQSSIPNDYTLIGTTDRTFTTIDGGKTFQYGFTPTTNSFINGRIFIDRNGNNIFEPDGQDGNPANSYDNDESLANQTVELYFGNNYNQLAATTQTDAQGNYTFSGLAEGIYTIRSTNNAPSGTQCYNSNATVNCGNGLTLSRNNSITNNIRYNYNARLRLSSFYDTITNFVRDSEFEVDVEDGTFTLFAPDGSQVGNAVNPIPYDSGSYNVSWQFSDLKPGTYTIQFNNLPSTLRGYSNPDTIVIAPSQDQVRDYPLTAQTNNAINGNIFIDKQQGVNQGLNNQYNPNGGDNNLATLFDNDEALTNTEVKIIGPLGTYTTNTNSGAGYSFSSLPSGKYKLFKLINNGATQVPNLTLDANNPNIANISLNSWNQTSWVRNATTNSHNTTYRYTNEISAYCYDDKDLNGQITYYPDSNTFDRRSSACSFEVETSDGQIIPLDSNSILGSDVNGQYYYSYHFKSNLPPGNYILRNTNDQSTTTVTNFTSYEPSAINYGITRQANINFAQNSLFQVSRANMFLSFSPITNNASIIGQVYIDRNNNGIFEPNGVDGNLATLEDNDVPLNNVMLSLTQNPANINKNGRTDENGNYQITDLPAGVFKIEVDLVQK